MLTTLFSALLLPIGVPILLTQVDGTATRIGLAAAATFVYLWMVSGIVRWRAGSNGTLGAMTGNVALTTGLLVGAAVGLVWFRGATREDSGDFFGAGEAVLIIGVLAAATFVVVAVLLSAVRAAGHRLR